MFQTKFMLKFRESDKDFIRERKLSFTRLVLMQINMLKASLQKEIVNFFQVIDTDVKLTKSAFSQRRKKLKPEAFVDLNEVLIDAFYSDDDFLKWKGYRLSGIDGSTMNLPFSKEIEDFFGTLENQTDRKLPMAKISSCYDLLNEIILDGQISSYVTSEYDLAIKHFEKLKKGDLVLLDRGYGAKWLFFLLIRREIDFAIRISRSLFTDFWSSNCKSKIVTITSCSKESSDKLKKMGIEFKDFKVRLVKVILDTGEIEVLVTSLYSKTKYPDEVFKNLYSLRWGIEQNYNHLKNHIEIENLSGKSVSAVKQDFFANALIENIRSLIARDAQIDVDEQKNNLKYKYKVNKNLSIGFLKDEIIRLMLSKDPDYIEKIIDLFTIEPVPIRPNRNVNRKKNKSMKRHRMNYRRSF